MSKYYAVILLATCFLAVLQHPARWRYLASASPYVSSAVAALICVPHLVWLVRHRAPPIRYLASISGQDWLGVLVYAEKTLIGAAGMNLGVIAVVALVAWITRRDRVPAVGRDEDGTPVLMLATLALAPLVLTVVAALALRTRNTPEMTVGTFALLPLLAIELSRVRDIERLYRIACRLAAVVTFGALALSPVIAAERAWLSKAAMKVPPFQEVAAEGTRIWHEQTSLPLTYVGGSEWYENLIAFYSLDRPHVFAHFDYDRNPWVTPELLAKHGLLSVCDSSDKNCLAETAPFETPDTTRTQITLAHTFLGHVASPMEFTVTVIPPHQ